MNIDIFIPVHLNSKRIPKKHLQLNKGKPVSSVIRGIPEVPCAPH